MTPPSKISLEHLECSKLYVLGYSMIHLTFKRHGQAHEYNNAIKALTANKYFPRPPAQDPPNQPEHYIPGRTNKNRLALFRRSCDTKIAHRADALCFRSPHIALPFTVVSRVKQGSILEFARPILIISQSIDINLHF